MFEKTLGNGSTATIFFDGHQNYLGISIIWGLAWTMGFLISGKVTGAHLNPAFSLALAAVDKFDCSKLVVYMCAQYTGAFGGAFIIYLTYFDAMKHFDKYFSIPSETKNASSILWTTFPDPRISTINSFYSTIIASAVFMFSMSSIRDAKNTGIPLWLQPLFTGFSRAAVTYVFHGGEMIALNPARDFSSRIFLFSSGWHSKPFKDNFFWIGFFGPYIGFIVGAWLYVIGIELHLPKKKLPVETIIRPFGGSEVDSVEGDIIK